MSYEQLRSRFQAQISGRFPPELLHDALQALDFVAADFDIRKSCVDLITVEEIPEVVKLYIASLAVEQCSQGTIKGYYNTLKNFFAQVRKPYTHVTTNDIRVYMYRYQQERKVQKATLEHLRVTINAFFNWLVDEEYLERNPARKISPIDVPRPDRHAMTLLELEYLRSVCQSPREKALVDFLFSTGCRISECAAIRLDDITWQDRAVRIRHGKGDKARTVYFNAESEVSLKHYLESKENPSPYLFSKSRAPYGMVTAKALQDEVKNICSRASDHLQTHVTPHVFRHTMATTALRSGMPVEQVQQLLGHSRLDTTMIYAKVDQQDIKISHQKHIG